MTVDKYDVLHRFPGVLVLVGMLNSPVVKQKLLIKNLHTFMFLSAFADLDCSLWRYSPFLSAFWLICFVREDSSEVLWLVKGIKCRPRA